MVTESNWTAAPAAAAAAILSANCGWTFSGFGLLVWIIGNEALQVSSTKLTWFQCQRYECWLIVTELNLSLSAEWRNKKLHRAPITVQINIRNWMCVFVQAVGSGQLGTNPGLCSNKQSDSLWRCCGRAVSKDRVFCSVVLSVLVTSCSQCHGLL
jgi:hypothetical protein